MSDAPSRTEIAKQINDKFETLICLETAKQHLEARKNAEISAVVKRYAEQLDPIIEQRKELVDEVVPLLNDNEFLLTEGVKKSVSFRYGEAKWRNSPASLVVDVDESTLLKLIRRFGGARRFIIKSEAANKTALKQDERFLAKLIGRKAVHYEAKRTLQIKLAETNINIVSESDPYRVKVEPTE